MTRLFTFFLFGALAVSAQTFGIRVLQGSSGTTVENNGTVVLAAEAPRAPVAATIAITNRGTNNVSFTRPTQTGSLDFEFSGLPDDTAVNLAAGQTLTFPVRYTPRSSARAEGRLVLSYTELNRPGTLTLNFVGTAPEYVFSFVPQGGNATPLVSGATIAFPLTAIDATSNATVVINNRGTAPGAFNSATVSGANFQLAGVPLTAAIDPGRDVRFTVQFTPRQLDPATGVLSVSLAGADAEFNLTGTGSGAVFTHELVQPTAGPLAPDTQITAPDTPVGEKSTVTVRVRNTGNADGRITAIAVQGAAFSLSDVPFLPLLLAPGSSAIFTVNFSPTESGRTTGRLRVGDASFELVGSGLGAVLSYSYMTGDTSTTVNPSGNVVFTPVALGRSSSVQFRVQNTGTLATTVNAISIAGSDVFTIDNLPSFPAQLAPGATLPVTVTFTPKALGAATATLRVNALTFALTGSGTNPAALPTYRIEGPTGAQEPRTQPTVRIVLASPYTLPITGTFALTFSSEVFADDPAVQFASGGRNLTFTIPANTTTAVFPDGSTQARMQTGTVAGTITLTPSFATDTGVSLTPQNPPTLRFSVAQSAPRILNAVLSAKTTTGFTIQVTGYSTSRSVQRMNLTFSARSGETVETTSLQLNVESNFIAWYQSAASQPFGSLFTITVPLTLSGDVKGKDLLLIDTVTSVAVTLTNAQGTSNSATVEVK